MLVMLNAQVTLKAKPQEHTYEIKPNGFLSCQYPSMRVIPTIYIVSNHVNTVVLFVLVKCQKGLFSEQKCNFKGF